MNMYMLIRFESNLKRLGVLQVEFAQICHLLYWWCGWMAIVFLDFKLDLLQQMVPPEMFFKFQSHAHVKQTSASSIT